jgi:hypothetical protein
MSDMGMLRQPPLFITAGQDRSGHMVGTISLTVIERRVFFGVTRCDDEGKKCCVIALRVHSIVWQGSSFSVIPSVMRLMSAATTSNS